MLCGDRLCFIADVLTISPSGRWPTLSDVGLGAERHRSSIVLIPIRAAQLILNLPSPQSFVLLQLVNAELHPWQKLSYGAEQRLHKHANETEWLFAIASMSFLSGTPPKRHDGYIVKSFRFLAGRGTLHTTSEPIQPLLGNYEPKKLSTAYIKTTWEHTGLQISAHLMSKQPEKLACRVQLRFCTVIKDPPFFSTVVRRSFKRCI